MCLIKKHKLPKIAWKPIKVYKVLGRDASTGQYYTPFLYVFVSLGDTINAYESWFPHLFSNTVLGEGVHSHIECPDIYFPYRVVVEAIIPRFSLYWEGEDGDIASTKLILTKKIVL